MVETHRHQLEATVVVSSRYIFPIDPYVLVLLTDKVPTLNYPLHRVYCMPGVSCSYLCQNCPKMVMCVIGDQ